MKSDRLLLAFVAAFACILFGLKVSGKSHDRITSWPGTIRIQGNSIVRFAIPQDVVWLRVYTSPEFNGLFNAYAEDASNRISIDPLRGSMLNSTSGSCDLVLTLGAYSRWRDSDIVTAHKLLNLDIKKRDGSHETKQIHLSIVPPAETEMDLVSYARKDSKVVVRTSVQDFFKGEIFDSGAQKVWAEPIGTQVAPDKSYLARRVGPREWDVLLPVSTSSTHFKIAFQQSGWTDASITVHMKKNDKGAISVVKDSNNLDDVPYIDIPDYKKWIRIGPVYPPNFVKNQFDVHDTLAVFADPASVSATKRLHALPIGMVLVKESRPFASNTADSNHRPGQRLIEFSKYVGGSVKWVYTGIIPEKDVKLGTRLYAFQTPTCFNCHYHGGTNNTFVARYPMLLDALQKPRNLY